MEIDFLIVADAVEAVNGKLYMLGGGWNQVTLSQFPAPVRIGIALGLLVPLSDMSEKHQLQVTIFDPNNRLVAQMQAEIGTRPPTRPAAVPSRFAIALNMGFQ